jgi:glycosyltransferase involved in cell wall biosynthesis
VKPGLLLLGIMRHVRAALTSGRGCRGQWVFASDERFDMLFTVFTPVYNRRHLVHRVWESLNAQTLRDFEWIVVDDGSQDNVAPLLEQYKQQADFPVKIYQQPNSGKHIAWNLAVREAEGELFVPADSDDTFVPEALERFKALWQGLSIDERQAYSGVNVLCISPETGETIGDPYPATPMVSNGLELVYWHGLDGEKWGCIRVDVLRAHPFPNIIRQGYFPESYIWFSLAREYRVLCVNEGLRHYFTDTASSITEGMQRSVADRFSRGAEPRYQYKMWHLNQNLDFIKRVKKELLKTPVDVAISGLMAGHSIRAMLRKTRRGGPRWVFLASLPLALLLYSRVRFSRGSGTG